MNPIYLNIFIFWTAIVASLASFISIPTFRKQFTSSYKEIGILIIIAFIAKYPLFHNYFFGLENEDSYVYNACARSYQYVQDFSVDPFFTKCCSVGSLSDCQSSSTYSGHLITFSSIVYFFFLIFGYSTFVILYINLFFSIISVIFIYLLANNLLNSKSYSVIVSLIFSLTPIMNVIHTSGLSETFSSTFILLFLYLYYMRFYKQGTLFDYKSNILYWLSLISSFIVAVLAKRENLVLILVPFFTIIFNFRKKRLVQQLLEMLPLFLTVIVLAAFYNYYIDINASRNAEVTDAVGNPFNFKFIYSLLPMFIKSYFTFKWFTIFPYLCLLGIILTFAKHKGNSALVSILLLFFVYLFIYSIHFQSFYFVKSSKASILVTFRYINNFFPLFCILAGLPIYYLLQLIKYDFSKAIKINLLILVPFVILIGALIVHSHQLKEEFCNIEKTNRISPVLRTINVVKEPAIVITDEPCVFQIFANSHFPILTLSLIGRYFSESEFDRLVNNKNVYYLKKQYHNDSIEINRHPNAFRIINKFKQQIIIQEKRRFQLLKLTTNNEL